jgi:hypothetical protein
MVALVFCREFLLGYSPLSSHFGPFNSSLCELGPRSILFSKFSSLHSHVTLIKLLALTPPLGCSKTTTQYHPSVQGLDHLCINIRGTSFACIVTYIQTCSYKTQVSHNCMVFISHQNSPLTLWTRCLHTQSLDPTM